MKEQSAETRKAPVRPAGLVGWFIVGALAGLGVIGFLTGLVLIVPALVLGLLLSDRGFKGAWMVVSGFGAGVVALLFDDLSDAGACDDWIGQSCRGIDTSGTRVAFFVGAVLVIAGILGTAIAARRGHADDELRF